MEFEVQSEADSPGYEFIRAITFTYSGNTLKLRYVIDDRASAPTFDLCDLISSYFVSHVENVRNLEFFQEIVMTREGEQVAHHFLGESIEVSKPKNGRSSK